MDFANLNTEFENLNQSYKGGLSILNNLNNFFKNYYKYGESFMLNTQKSMETLFNEQLKCDNKSTQSKVIFEFYRTYEILMVKYKGLLSNLDKDLIDPLNLYYSHYGGIFQEIIQEFKSIMNITYETKKNLATTKHKYFESCKSAQEQEKILMKILNDKEKKKNSHSDEALSFANDTLLKYRAQAENNCQLYKYELIKTNKIYEENDKRYFNLKEKLRSNEESRIYFIKCHIEKFSKLYEEYNQGSDMFSKRILGFSNEVNIDEDVYSLCDKNSFTYENKIRIPREEFLNYDIYRRNLEALNSSHQTESTVAVSKSSNHEEDEEINSNDNLSENYQTKIINDLLKVIYLDKEVKNDEITRLVDCIENNMNISAIFIEKIITKEKKNLFIKFNNFNNLILFSNILNKISISIDNPQSEFFDLNFAIIYLAERSYFSIDGKRKIYLCSILSRSKLYSSRKFWVNIIEIKIKKKIDEHLKIFNSNQAKIANSRSNSQPSNENSARNSNMIGNLTSKFKTFFTGNQIISTPPHKPVDQLSTLLIDKIKMQEATTVLNECIPHFANFNFEVSDAIDIIVEISTRFNFTQEKISFFVSKLNSNNFTIKKKYEVDEKPVNPKVINLLSKYNKHSDSKFASISVSMEFLKPRDYLNMMLVNKNYFNKFGKIFYKKLLLKSDIDYPIEFRLNIWRNILRIDLLKKKINYQKILEDLSNPNNDSIQIPVNELISLDVQRTFFDENVEENRKSILNILKAIAYTKPQINYCQGMNYIASFIYLMCKNEEEAFYLMYSFIERTEYSSIFVDELSRLKQFFYVFERLLFLYLPEIYSYFRYHQVIVSYFCSPWFITLFTNAHQYLGDNINPKVIIRIWDEFLLNGWKSIMKNGLILLKSYESSILQLKYEDLLQFLISDSIKSPFFKTDGIENYRKLSNVFKVKPGLINNLENEYILEAKYKDIEEKRFLEQKHKIEKLNFEKENMIKI